MPRKNWNFTISSGGRHLIYLRGWTGGRASRSEGPPGVGKTGTGNEAGENGKGSGSAQKCKGEGSGSKEVKGMNRGSPIPTSFPLTPTSLPPDSCFPPSPFTPDSLFSLHLCVLPLHSRFPSFKLPVPASLTPGSGPPHSRMPDPCPSPQMN